MAWCRSGDKPLSETMMVSLPTHIYVTRLQWVNACAFILVFMHVKAVSSLVQNYDAFSMWYNFVRWNAIKYLLIWANNKNVWMETFRMTMCFLLIQTLYHNGIDRHIDICSTVLWSGSRLAHSIFLDKNHSVHVSSQTSKQYNLLQDLYIISIFGSSGLNNNTQCVLLDCPNYRQLFTLLNLIYCKWF